MVSTTRLISICLALALLGNVAVAEQSMVKEPATGVEFPETREGLRLLGVGVRKKLVFKVYAAALYVSLDGLKATIEDRKPASLYKAVRYGPFRKLMVLHFVRDVPANKVRDTFEHALRANMPEKDWKSEKKHIDAFLARCVDVKKGQTYVLRTTGGKISISLDEKVLFEVDSIKLAWGMWGGWFGKHPASESLRAELVSRAELVLRE